MSPTTDAARALELLAELPEPTPDAVRSAREAAGHTQAQAAALAGFANNKVWWMCESGARGMSRATWALYLLATGQHPHVKAAPRRRGKAAASRAPSAVEIST